MNCESLSTIIHGYEIQPLDVWYLRNSLALWVPNRNLPFVTIFACTVLALFKRE